MINEKNEVQRRQLQTLSAQDFLNVGLDHIVYVRQEENGKHPAYSINAADGTRLAVQDSWETAAALARQNNRQPVMTH